MSNFVSSYCSCDVPICDDTNRISNSLKLVWTEARPKFPFTYRVLFCSLSALRISCINHTKLSLVFLHIQVGCVNLFSLLYQELYHQLNVMISFADLPQHHNSNVNLVFPLSIFVNNTFL